MIKSLWFPNVDFKIKWTYQKLSGKGSNKDWGKNFAEKKHYNILPI